VNTFHLVTNLSACNVMPTLNCYVWIPSINTNVQLWMFLRFLLLVLVLLKILCSINKCIDTVHSELLSTSLNKPQVITIEKLSNLNTLCLYIM
jgi:hypothetical protein